ncbi:MULTISPECIES: hypothetical protein [Acidobacteriaceae]|uniref:hypothetical protein n=1 Tax=Acidobacteriaceae TaxID=204434 RepID=UPI00131DF56B|nr:MULTISPECIES: hypothetical protein [Acidobacteriaceae]MDW5267595.1 hypothetical protein [Edaphobacter sp.]
MTKITAISHRNQALISQAKRLALSMSREGLTETQARTIANFDHVTINYQKTVPNLDLRRRKQHP